jgi:malonyl-CoA/methylmalonyl-CoA synthetase
MPANAHVPDGVEVDLLGRRSLPAAWRDNWEREPGSPALSDDGTVFLTNAELEERTRRAARRLAALGIEAGQRVLISAQPSVEMAVAHVAALRLGCAVVPMNTAYREREVAHIVGDSAPSLAIVDADERAKWIRDASGAGIPIVGTAVDGRDEADVELDAAQPQDAALLIYTSGTTGAPKGAVLSHANVLAGAEAVRIAWRWTSDDRLILTLPLFHMHGLGVGLHGTLLAGASAVIPPGFDPGEVTQRASDPASTLFFGVPTMYSRLATAPDVGNLGRLRLCVAGSAALSVELFEQIEAATGQRVLERYGMSETLMNMSNPYDGERRPGTVGFPLPGVEARLADDGEIQLRGPNVFAGYWQRPDATAAAFTSDGWFMSGDVGEVDADGYYRIVGRTKELIISGGYNVYPREVEEVLLRHPAIEEVAVAGTPSSEWGEVVTAYVVRSGECDAASVMAFAAADLAPYKRPRLVHFVDALPRNALGKVVRAELRPGT